GFIMKHLNETTNVNILSQFDLGTGYQAVVQKGNVGKKYVYALQLRKGVTTILRGYRGNKINSPILKLSDQAGGHTQTWEFAGNHKDINGNDRAGQWFVGVKPTKIQGSDIIWARQMARVDINTQAGPHAEAAVSANYKKFLIATIENNRIGHFTIYDLDKINQALDKSGKYKDVSLDGFEYEDSFTINNLYGNAEDAVVNSIQGYDLDNDGNIYISSQKSPDFDGSYHAYHKQIVKIPWNGRSETKENQWESVNLSAFGGLDISKKHSEVESIQILSENHCYLTVAYHSKLDGKNKTTLNRIYELSWS